MFKITEFSKLAGLTIRTLQYYDEIGLVVPRRSENGHRVYTYADLVLVNEIILLKDTGFKLEDIIKNVSQKEDTNLNDSLIRQKQILTNKISEIRNQLGKIEYLIAICNKDQTIEKEVLQKIFIENNPLKEKINTIWNLDFNDVRDLSYLKNFDGSFDFDIYFHKLSKFQNYDISDDVVQKEIKHFVTCLNESYGSSINLDSILEFATLYKENEQAKEHLLKYGEHFNNFLADAMIYFINNVI